MTQKLLELSEILKQKPEIKERLKYKHKFVDGCFVEVEPAYHDVLEYLGIGFTMDCFSIDSKKFKKENHIYLSPGPLSDQTDETLDEIISLCKNVGRK